MKNFIRVIFAALFVSVALMGCAEDGDKGGKKPVNGTAGSGGAGSTGSTTPVVTPVPTPATATAGVNIQYNKSYILAQLQQTPNLTLPSVFPYGKKLTDHTALTFTHFVDFEIYLLANNLRGAITLRQYEPLFDPYAMGSKLVIPYADIPPYPFGFTRKYKNWAPGDLVGWHLVKQGNANSTIISLLSGNKWHWFTDSALNPINDVHVWVEPIVNLGIILVRFEDNKDEWNDFLFAVNIGTENALSVQNKLP